LRGSYVGKGGDVEYVLRRWIGGRILSREECKWTLCDASASK
jgi:hypothetical protein